MNCIENIIGITNSDCPCILNGLTPEEVEELKTSTSGLYLDSDLGGSIGISQIKELDKCTSYFELAKKAINSAKKSFTADILSVLSSKNTKKANNFIGSLGRLFSASTLDKTKKYQFLKISPKAPSNAKMQIRGIRLGLNKTSVVNFKILAVKGNDTTGEIIFETTTSTSAGIFSQVTTPNDFILPLSDNGIVINYYCIWEKSEDIEMPLDNGLSCGCSGGDPYDKFVALTGGETDTLDNIQQSFDRYAHGINVEVTLYCDLEGAFCQNYNNDEAVKLVAAYAVLYKSGELLSDYILQSPEVNRFTMMSREQLMENRAVYRAEYDNRITYLSEHCNILDYICYSCKNNQMFVGNIY